LRHDAEWGNRFIVKNGTHFVRKASVVALAGGLFLQTAAWAQTAPAQQNAGLLMPSPAPTNLDAPTPTTKEQTVVGESHRKNGTSEKATNSEQSSVMDEVRLETPDEVSEAGTTRLQAPAFMVRQINVEGATLFSAAELHALVASYEGKEQTLEVLNTAADAINKLYQNKGYPTTRAFIPPQDVENGILTIHVQEGTIGKISLEGAKYYKARVILNQNTLSQKPGDLLNVPVLENELNRSNRINEGYRFKAILAAGEIPGQTDIKLKVAEREPLQISPTFDNEGRPYIGMFRSGVEIRNDSVTGNGDRLYARLLGSSGSKMLTASYSYPINQHGTQLNVNVGYSSNTFDLGGRNQPNFSGKAISYGIGLIQPLDKDHHWIADGGLLWRHIGDFADGYRSNLTDIRAFQAGLTYNRYDRLGRTYNRTWGMLALGGIGGTSHFFKVEDYFTRIILLPKRNMLLIKGYGQWSPGAVPVAEQYQVGGYNSVRGFTEGVLLGDKGLSAGIEERFPIPLLGKISPWLDQRVQGAVFYDIGRTWLNSSNDRYIAGQSNAARNTLLQSAGVGLRAQLTRYLQGFVDVGIALGGNAKDIEPLRHAPTARIHIGVRSDLMPNDYKVRTSGSTPLMTRPFSLARPLTLEPSLMQFKSAQTN
jgi:hemolysin activation/secretion protein